MGKNKLFLLMAGLATGTVSYAQVDVTNKITNPSFETGDLTGWTVGSSSDTGVKPVSNSTYATTGCDGSYVFNTWWQGIPITQEVKELQNGLYTLSALVTSGNGNPDEYGYVYLLANGQHNEAIKSPEGGTFRSASFQFEVTNNKVTIGAVGGNADGSFNAGGYWWYKADKFQLSYDGAEITSSLKNPNFDNGEGWKVSDDCTNKNLSGGDAGNKNAESYHSVFTISQELSVPNGTYYLVAQGFYRQDGSDNTNLPYFFANDSKENLVNIVSVGKAAADGANGYTTLRDGVYIPNSMGDASKVFSSGACVSSRIKVVVTDGKLTVGVANPNNKNLWVIWDNFRLFIDPAQISALQTSLTQKLAIQINKANKYTGDKTLQDLAVDASKIQVKINALTEDVSTYSSIVAEIEAIGAQIAKATANYEAYQAAVAAHGTLETKLADLTTEYNKAAKETQDAAQKTYDSNVDLVDQFKKDAEKAYNAGTAGTEFATDNITKKTTAITTSIDTAIDAIKNGSTNAFSHANVAAEIVKAKVVYNTQADALYTLLAGAEDGKIYNDTYVEALAELNSSLRAINKVEEENEALYLEGKADATTQAGFITRLDNAKKAMADVYTAYDTKATTLRANYKAACDDVKSLTADLKTDIEDAIGDKRDEVKNFYADNVAAIKSSIAALQANVDAANVAHTIAGTNPFCKDYGTDRNKITKAISDLKALVDESVAEFDAHQATLTAIAAAETAYNDSKNGKGKKDSDAFDANYKGVDNLVSDNKAYTTKDRFAASEKSITDAIAALRTAAAADYKVDGTGKARQFNSTGNVTVDGKTRKGLTAINAEIVAYRKNAEDALAAYNTVANAIAAYKDALNGTPAVGEVGDPGYVPATPGLVGTATEKDVTIDGDLASKSYKTAIEELNTRIATVEDNLGKALAKADVAHKTALEAIDVDAAIATDITKLITDYASNETTWNANQVAAAKLRMLNEAQRRIEAVKALFYDDNNVIISYDATIYGLKAAGLNTDLGNIDAKLTTVINAKNTAEGQDGATAIAALSEVAKSLEEIEADVTKLTEDAAAAKDEYAKETKANTTLTNALAEIKIYLNGGTLDEVTIKSVNDLLNSAADFSTEISNQSKAITDVEGEIAASYGAETLRKDAADTKNDQDEVTKVGYTNRVAEIKAAVESLRTLAGLEAENKAAKDDFDAKVTAADVTAAKAQAATDIAAVATGDGLTFFSGELTKYWDEYNQILTDEGTAYNKKVKSTAPGTIENDPKYTDTNDNMKAKAASLEARLNAVKANITGLKALADANEKAHNAQVAAANTSTTDPKFTCTSDRWAEIFAEVTNDETTSAHEAAIATLTGLKSDLTAYNAAVKKAWGEGKCDTDKATIEAQLTTINNALETLAASWDDIYAAAVAVDNQARKENFDGAYTKLTTAYAAAVDVIAKMSKLSYAANQTPTLLAITGEGGIFDYATKIRTLKDDATTAYETAQKAKPIEQFDAEEAYKALAGTYQKSIEGLAKQYTDEVNAIAMTTFTTAKSDAETKYDAAVNAIKSTLGLSDKDAKKAVADVRTIIDEAVGATTDQDFAYTLDYEILPAFATIDAKLTNDKETAAVNTWESNMKASYQLAQTESKALAEFIAEDGTKGKSSESYANFVKGTITDGGEVWNKIAEGSKFAEYATAWVKLNGFISTESKRKINKKDQIHTALYWAAYDEDVAFHANDDGFETMKKDIAVVQKALDNAKAYIGAMLVEHNAGLMGQIAVVQTNIDNLTSDAESYHNTNTAKVETNQDAINGECKTQLNNIDGIIAASIPAEEAEINIEIGLLKNDYDRATAADIENSAIDAYKDIIDGYKKENAKIAEEYTTGKKDDKGVLIVVDGNPVKATAEETQAAFLALEKKIGVTKNELAAFYDAAATANAIAAIQAAIDALNATYADLETQLADCHEPVQDKYQSAMEAFKAEIDAAQAELETETAYNTVLLYEENNLTSIQNIAKAYKNLSSDIAKDEAPYDVNDAKYAELCGQLATLTANLAAVDAAAAAYEYQVTGSYTIDEVEYTNYREYMYARLTADIAAEQKAIDGLNENVQLFASSTVNKDGIQSSIDYLERYLANYNANRTRNAVSSALNNALNDQNSRIYTSADYAELSTTYNSLYSVWNNARQYNSGAYAGTVSKDIDGNVILDENEMPTTKTVKYMEEYPAIMERFAELAAAVAEYANDVNLKSFIMGDVNHDRKVNVADYSAVRNIALGFTEVEPASAIFLAADVNHDGEITVADVTAIAQYIMSGNKNWPEGAGSRSAMKNRDAISVAMTANNGKQQVVISLNNKFEYVAAQMDIQLPAGMKLVGESLTSRANGHELLSNDVNGAHRVLISTLANSAFLNNETALVVLDVEVTDEYQGGMIQVNNAIFADASAHAYKLADVATGETTGIDALTVDVKNATIYDFSGRRVFNVKKGNFYIINGKSVLVK